MTEPSAPDSNSMLKRNLGLGGATLIGLGSMVGTGVFVSIGIAAGIAGPAVLLAIALAALVAMCNAFSSAQLAATHSVSGGTYEYGYVFLDSRLGFTAGWMFLLAKSASAATAALGFAGYALPLFGIDGRGLLVPVALGIVVVLTLVVLGGVRRTNWTNVVIVSVTLGALGYLVVGGFPTLLTDGAENLTPFFESPDDPEASPFSSLLYATALMFVAYTGYGRIATLGEEVREPERTIPRAVVVTLIVVGVLYMAVGAVSVGVVGAGAFGIAAEQEASPLQAVMRALALPGGTAIIGIGAMTAMLGVLLNLILGLSRVALAMGRRRDLPGILARLNAAQTTPYVAVLAVGAIIAALTLIGNVRVTWSFSAFTVLIYYAITNLSALQLPEEQRLYSRYFAWGGLLACLFLAFWVDWVIWLTGLGLIAAGLLWHEGARRMREED